MDKKDKILLNLLTLEKNLRKKSTLVSLHALQQKYPHEILIKRAIAEFYQTNKDYNLAICYLIQIISTRPQKTDIYDLIVLSMKTDCMKFVFFDLKLFEKLKSFKFAQNAILLLLNRKLVVDFAFSNISNMEGRSNSKLDLKPTIDLKEEKDSKFNSNFSESYVNEKNIKSCVENLSHEYMTQSSNNNNCRRINNFIEPNQLVSMENDCYLYHHDYQLLMNKIASGSSKEIFNILYHMFKTNDPIETLDLLLDLEKTEILYFLSRRFQVFQKDYQKVIDKISKSLSTILELILKQEDSSLINSFVINLQKRNTIDQ